MNPTVQKFAPPAVVFGVALYLGLPPAAPLDLGESVVKAATVRWKKEDLQPPAMTKRPVDPFREVLVASKEMEVEPETGKLVVATKPSGPTPEDVKSGLVLTGVASMGGRSWAVINGKPRLPGDSVRTNDAKQLLCTIVSVANDHVVVACRETEVELRPNEFATTAKPATLTPVSHSTNHTTDAAGQTNPVSAAPTATPVAPSPAAPAPSAPAPATPPVAPPQA